MRAYTVADVFVVADLFAAVVGAGGKLGGLLKASGGGGGSEEAPAAQTDSERGWALAYYLLGECMAKCREQLVSWLASLNEMTIDEFNTRPPELLIDTVEAIVTGPESKDFFLRASRLSQKIVALRTFTESK